MWRILNVVLLVTYYTFTPHMERYTTTTSYVYALPYDTYVVPFMDKMLQTFPYVKQVKHNP
jgi:hypothetical protein